MRTTVSPDRTRRAALLYAGVIVVAVLAVLTARSVARAWDERAAQARTAAVVELVQQRMPSRPVEAPGAIAWLRDQLARYRAHLPPDQSSAFGRLLSEADDVPPELQRTAAVLRMAVAHDAPGHPVQTSYTAPANSRRTVSIVRLPAASAVVTRRLALDASPDSNALVSAVLPVLGRITAALADADLQVARPVRLYVFAEDGTLVSSPFGAPGETTGATIDREALQLSTRPELPSFAPEEFFFRFDDPRGDEVRYSGFYVDLGGRGLVSTLTRPIEIAGQNAVLALDLTHMVDWDHFAATIQPPLAAAIVHTGMGGADTWGGLRRSLPDGAAAPIRSALDAVGTQGSGAIEPIAHAVVGGSGAIAAFNVADGAWLLTFFPSTTPAFPTGTVALLAAMLGVLLIGFEVTRRWAEREADRAAQALGEKQNLLNTMEVPLVVVDPNTDEIVSANRVAESIGIRKGAHFADRVSRDPRAQAHYAATQVATTDRRRAYGVPIRVEGDEGASDQFAVVRSVAVTAPIEALSADERHRLAILFLVDPRSDLKLLLDDVEGAAHADERRRLAGLLSHGVDPLAEVMRRSTVLDASVAPSVRWLAEYLQRRIHVTAWLLDHWDSATPAAQAVVDAAQAIETLRSLEGMFAAVRDDRELRRRLGWMNGPLSTAEDGAPFVSSVDWPDEFELTLPVRGGLGFFLTEVLTNAMRHGAPGHPPRVTITCDCVRKEIAFAVENGLREEHVRDPGRYSGLGLLRGMARLFAWQQFQAEGSAGTFRVSWYAAVSRRDRPGRPD